MAKREKHQEDMEKINESWLIPYSDILTLLLALFIVLFSMTAIDAQKFNAVSKIFGDIFHGGTGILDFSAPERNTEIGEKETPTNLKELGIDPDKLKKLQEIQKKTEAFIQRRDLENQLQTSLSDEGLLIRINDSVLFDSGSATVRKEDIPIAKEISELLVSDPPRKVVISGHTDNVPIHNSQFASNWELSVMRAVNFMKIILENKKLDPKMFSAKGYGEYQPIASNATEEGRQKNRRVEVLISPD